MCGIAGFIDFKSTSSIEILKKSTDTLLHRGPDASGYTFFQKNNYQVGLGHRRLSIIDLTDAGAQPMQYLHLHIIFNGEIYNHAEIREILKNKGHQFIGHSDTEVIIHAYKEWGKDCLQQFIGMFSIVIYNEEEETIFACRDRAGVKPLYYYWKNGLFIFGSELKALIVHPGFEKEINIDAAGAFMHYGYVPAQHCIFNHTNKLKAGFYLELNLTTQNISTQQYWNVYDAYNKPVLKISLPDAITETENLLNNAFQYRMVSDVPVGVFLSGGYDSSCVTALLQKDSTKKIKTFTIGVPDIKMNEAPIAKEIALHLGTDHTEYYCTEKEALEIVPLLPLIYDEPFADSSAIPTILVSKIAREKVTVALSADAGDEVFAGYNRYDYIIRYGGKIKSIPPVLRKSVAALMNIIPATSIPIFNKKRLFQNRYEKLKLFLQDPSEKNIMLGITQLMNSHDIATLFKSPIKKLSSQFDSNELSADSYNALNFMLAIDYQTYLPDDILQKVDRATMSVGLEGREPFLDHRIIEWAAQLPMEYKYNKGNKKFILKEIVHQYLPKKLMDRPKSGFSIPIEAWLQNELKPFVNKYLAEEFVIKQNIFNNQEVQRLQESFYNGITESGQKIWYLLMFQMWYDEWMN